MNKEKYSTPSLEQKALSVELKVNDSKNNPITIKIDPSKTAEGPQHVMKKHYQGNIGRVTATEILNMLDIVRKGTIHTPSDNHILYSLKKRVNGVTYNFCIKITKKNKIFKSFYSNR